MINNESPLVHHTALISTKANVDPSVRVGAFTIVNDNVIIEKDVVIGSGCIIGAEPFDDRAENQYSINIRENVWIGDNVHIQSGVLRNTLIGEGSSINHGCYIGHDVELGSNCIIGLAVTISGHSKVGSNVRIGPGSTLNNRSKIGDHARIGIGSLVLHPVENHMTVVGRPAKEIEEQKKMASAMRNLIGISRKSIPVTSATPRLKKFKKFLQPIFILLPMGLKRLLRNILIR